MRGKRLYEAGQKRNDAGTNTEGWERQRAGRSTPRRRHPLQEDGEGTDPAKGTLARRPMRDRDSKPSSVAPLGCAHGRTADPVPSPHLHGS